MAQSSTSPEKGPANLKTCDRCGALIKSQSSFQFRSKPNGTTGAAAPITKCLTCTLRHGPMLRRSIIAALVVGTVLTLLNQGDTLLSGDWNNALFWKIPLTYCVPFLVATYGALSNSRN